jgi:hypothetical protein
MDYSLLIGIHDLARGNSENIRSTTLSVYQPKAPLHRIPSKRGKEVEQPPLKRLATNLPNEEFLERKLGFFTSEDGGLFATNAQDESTGDYIYYFGVIDLLTTVLLQQQSLTTVWTEETSRDVLQRVLVPQGSIICCPARSIRRPLRQIYSRECQTKGGTSPPVGRAIAHCNPGRVANNNPCTSVGITSNTKDR